MTETLRSEKKDYYLLIVWPAAMIIAAIANSAAGGKLAFIQLALSLGLIVHTWHLWKRTITITPEKVSYNNGYFTGEIARENIASCRYSFFRRGYRRGSYLTLTPKDQSSSVHIPLYFLRSAGLRNWIAPLSLDQTLTKKLARYTAA